MFDPDFPILVHNLLGVWKRRWFPIRTTVIDRLARPDGYDQASEDSEWMRDKIFPGDTE